MRIGFIGLGRMGTGMAMQLLRAGHELVVFNRTRAKAEELARAGASIAETPADATRGAQAVVTMVADDAALEAVVLGERGLLETLPPGAVHVSSSTIAPATARRLASAHARAGKRYVAAPVVGRPEAANQGQLVVLVAGAEDALADAQPVFDAIGRETFVLGGEPERANVVKLALNFVFATLIEVLGEAYALAESYGVDDRAVLDVLGSVLKSPVVEAYGDKIAKDAFDPAGFALKLGAKDVRLVVDAAEANAVPMPIANLLRYRFVAALAQGLGDEDWSAVARASTRRTAA
jgi:3-hydroxyisobutyrate dehydrogenase-like beta-hydroxyacid dehydrogenase